jgi:hypothetical protein
MTAQGFVIAGALAMGYAVAGLFFLRFWKRTGDRLFAIFACAFWILAAQRLGLAAATYHNFDTTWLYGLRLLAFTLILWAIVDKNRASR